MTRSTTSASSGTNSGSHREQPGDPQSRFVEWACPCDHLMLQPGSRPETPFVEDLGCEPADSRSKPPRLGQEDAAIRRNGLMVSENVLQRRDICAFGMGALLWLLHCWGPPSNTTLPAHCEVASTFASDIWPASSTNRTSTAFSASGRAHSQAVPSRSLMSPLARPASASLTNSATKAVSSRFRISNRRSGGLVAHGHHLIEQPVDHFD